MQRISRSGMVILFFVLAAFTSAAAAQSFDPVFDWVDRFRQGEDVELEIRVQEKSFSVVREQVTSIDQATFDQLLSNASARRTPRLRLTPEAEVSVYALSDNLIVEEHVRRNPPAQEGPKAWAKREFVSVAAYPTNQWGEFLKAALPHGLTEYTESEVSGTPIITLYFKQIGPNLFQSGPQSLTFTDEFYEFMKLSPHYKPTTGTEGFVVIVHEPHWGVSGQFQLVPGLKALLSANQPHPFIFLVEGEYEPPSREIGFNTLDTVIDRARGAGPAEPLVYNLLSRFMTDGPLAYRLLYGRDIPSIAIDDLGLLEEAPRGSPPQSPLKERQAILKILEAAKGIKLPASEARQVGQKLIDALTYTLADARDLHGELLVAHYKKLADHLSALATVAQRLKQADPSLQVNAEIAFLEAQSQAYRSQCQIFEDALRRDVTMTGHISTYAKSARGRIPVAFIGNFHTDGITRRLRSQNVGYVVIEPRFNLVSSGKEREDFNRALYGRSRQDYLRSRRRKLPVNPTTQEVKEHYT